MSGPEPQAGLSIPPEYVPHALDAERAVIGTIMKNPAVMKSVMAGLPEPIYFYEPKHQIIYAAMLVIARHEELPDLVTVVAELQRRGKLDKIGGRVYLFEVIEDVASTSHHPQYVTLIQKRYQMRKIICICQEAVNSALSQELEPEELVGHVAPNLVQTVMRVQSRGFRNVGDMVADVLNDLDAIQRGERSHGLHTGFPSIDELIGGFAGGDLIFIGGRPRWGKTAFMMNVAERMLRAGCRVAMVSAETSCPEYITRALCTTGEVDSLLARTGKMSEKDWTRLVNAGSTICNWEYWIDDTPDVEIDTLCARTAELKKDADIDILFVDYLTKLTTARKFDQKRLAVDYTVGQLKTLAQTLDIPVVVASQLNRMIETRGGNSWRAKRPTLGDFKESGRIEEDADVVMALFRPDLYIGQNAKDRDRWKNTSQIIVLKQRKGPIGEVNLRFLPELTKYEELTYQPDELPF